MSKNQTATRKAPPLELQSNFSKEDITNPETRLILAIIESGLKESDHEYFHSRTFEYHAELLKIPVALFKRKFLMAEDQ